MCIWCCWKDLDEKAFHGIYLVRFGFRMWGDIDFFKVISATENSNKFQKTKSTLHYIVFTLEPMAQATLVGMKHGCA
jgi:hypothetical protein